MILAARSSISSSVSKGWALRAPPSHITTSRTNVGQGLCDTPCWMDPSSKRQWWLIGVAALLAAIFLRDAFGSWAAVGLIAAAIAALAGYQWADRKRPSTLRCLRSGEVLNPSARQCDSCGGASWKWKN